LEHFWRGLSHPKDQVSAIPPHGYGDRFFNFISSIVKSPEEAARDKERRNQAAIADAAREEASAPPTHNQGAERAGLPVVEEAGEGSRSGSSRGGSAHSVEYEGAPMVKNDSGLGGSSSGAEQHTTTTTVERRKQHLHHHQQQHEEMAIRVTAAVS
jgi:1-phosphatidylinositol-4-phosphate 5-kinase